MLFNKKQLKTILIAKNHITEQYKDTISIVKLVFLAYNKEFIHCNFTANLNAR